MIRKKKIKKILKQSVEKKNYNLKDYVVYPKHGVGKIISIEKAKIGDIDITCLLYTSPSPRDVEESRMPSSA